MLWRVIRREGFRVNHKRIERLYREEGLSLRRRRRRKRLSHLRVVRERPQVPNHTWSVDCVHDALFGGRRFRALTVIDEWSRECRAIEVDASLTGASVIRVLQRPCETPVAAGAKLTRIADVKLMGWTAPRFDNVLMGHDGTLDHRQQRSEEGPQCKLLLSESIWQRTYSSFTAAMRLERPCCESNWGGGG